MSRRAGLASLLPAVLALAPTLEAQDAPARPPTAIAESVYVRDVGPGEAGRILRRALLAPHVVLRSTDRLVLPRDTTIGTTVVVVGGGDVTVAARITGDIIVVDGDLFMHTGGHVAGRAVAIGGGAYGSTLARVEEGRLSFRDGTYDIVPTPAGLALDYRPLIQLEPLPVVALPGIYGVRIPSYDRVNGLSLAAGPRVNVDSGRVAIDPVAVYRSDLGTVDPQLLVAVPLGRRDSASVFAGRGTFTNDDWIRSDFWNSLLSLASGRDTRNWFRAERAEAFVHRRWEGAFGTLRGFVGGRVEEASTVGPDGLATSAPWSLFGRDDREDGMLRPNPPVDDGRITSALAGAEGSWESPAGLAVEGTLLVEQAFASPIGSDHFTQLTLDVDLAFPTFGSQEYRLETHGVFTGPDIAPRQRFAYLGGSGTLPTFDLLEFGGDELLFVEQRYIVPIDRVNLPLLGRPAVMVRHILGAAGPGRLPAFEQNVGVRLTFFLLKLDYVVDPRTGDSDLGVGISLTN